MTTERLGSAAPDIAVRIDEPGRYREVLEFFGDGPDRLAGCTHIPLGEPVGGVVACPSLYNEFMKNYRREVVLARELATQGIAVQRFSYRGTGNSDGEPEAITFESLRDDVLAAADRLREATGVERVAFLATRFGALAAAAAAADAAGAPVAFLEPVLRADRYFTEAVRARASAEMVGDEQQPGAGRRGRAFTKKVFTEMLDAAGEIDVVGYTLGRDLYHSSAGRTLADELGPKPRPLLVMQLGADGPVRPDLAEAVAGWQAQGFPVDFDQMGTRELWWFAEERDERPGAFETQPHGLAADDPVVVRLGRWLEGALSEVSP